MRCTRINQIRYMRVHVFLHLIPCCALYGTLYHLTCDFVCYTAPYVRYLIKPYLKRCVLHYILRLTTRRMKEGRKKTHLTSSWVSERKCELTPMMKGVGVLSTSSSFPGKMGTYVKLERVGKVMDEVEMKTRLGGTELIYQTK